MLVTDYAYVICWIVFWDISNKKDDFFVKNVGYQINTTYKFSFKRESNWIRIYVATNLPK